jgi:hypothetical protein
MLIHLHKLREVLNLLERLNFLNKRIVLTLVSALYPFVQRCSALCRENLYHPALDLEVYVGVDLEFSGCLDIQRLLVLTTVFNETLSWFTLTESNESSSFWFFCLFVYN